MNGAVPESERSGHALGWLTVARIAAYAAAVLAFSYAVISLYWTLGGHGLLGTVGGAIERFARRDGLAAVLLGLATTMAKAGGGLLALALVRPWGRVVPRAWLLIVASGASALLLLYGGAQVLVGSLVLSGAIHPSGGMDRTALRWHVGAWDLWFLVWGILLALATIGYVRRTASAGGEWPGRSSPRRQSVGPVTVRTTHTLPERQLASGCMTHRVRAPSGYP